MAAKAKTTQLPASLAGIDVSGDDLIRSIVEIVLNEMLEVQFSEQLGAAPYERSPERLGYRAGYYRRSLVTRVGKIILRVPRERAWRLPARSLVTEASLRVELANAKEQVRRLTEETDALRQRLARQLGSEADLARGMALAPVSYVHDTEYADLGAC